MGEKKLDKFVDEIIASAISPSFAQDNGVYESNDPQEIKNLLNRTNQPIPQGPYLVIPYYSLTKREEIISYSIKATKPLTSDGKEIKYLRPTGSKNHLYIPKSIPLKDLLDPEKPLIFTEGEKKTLSGNHNGFLTIGISGVANWRTKNDEGQVQPLSEFSEMNLKGRKVYICFDNDSITNPQVMKAEGQFASYLQNQGAEVKIIRLPFDGERKIGFDDFLVDYSKEEFQKLINEAIYPLNMDAESLVELIHSLKDKNPEEVNTAIKSIIPIVASKNPLEADILIKEIAKATKTTKKVVEAMVVNEKRKANLRRENSIIAYDSREVKTRTLLTKITEKIIEDERIYMEGNSVYLLEEDDKIEITESNFPSLLNEIVEVKFDGRYNLLPVSLAKGVLNSPRLLKNVPEIVLHTRTITYDDNWLMVSPGYNSKSKIFYTGEPVIPATRLSKIDELFQDFCFKNDASRVNAIGALLTCFFRHKFIGEKPLTSCIGNQPGLGKSLLADVIAIIMTDENSMTISYTSNEEELEKRIASSITRSDILNFDNVKVRKEVSSGCLERLITSVRPAFRKLGTNELIEKLNSFVVFISLNDASFSDDLLTRMCPIEFFYDGNPRARTFTKPDLKKWAYQNREEIISELLLMVETWKKKGKPLADINSRFTNWSKYIGGILEANGYKGFMSNFESAQNEYSPEAKEIGHLFSDCLNEWKTIEELATHAQTLGLFKGIMAKGNPNIALGRLLGKMVDQLLPLSDESNFTLRKSQDSKTRKVQYLAESQKGKKKAKKTTKKKKAKIDDLDLGDE